jgi:hypothetical protein
MKTTQAILSAEVISIEEANALLAAYPGIGEALAGIAVKLERTHRKVEIRPFSAAEIVQYWSGKLDRVVVGLVNFEASGMTQFGRVSVAIDKQSGQLATQEW